MIVIDFFIRNMTDQPPCFMIRKLIMIRKPSITGPTKSPRFASVVDRLFVMTSLCCHELSSLFTHVTLLPTELSSTSHMTGVVALRSVFLAAHID